MNASERTVIIARGIYYWAYLQNLRGDDDSSLAKSIWALWHKWCKENPKYVEFVREEQTALFDKVNSFE